ncbi:unnamed protein product [Didymodactylos carnosus]|uniref:Uncharacterized protein n=1 Tax=Didymodactylos carnosus TaxID=1234261 RepID=A0A814IGS7_9BILA|nr:unnamed protein product [Didymodactylos carnosus]CAF1403700.1 unnamed protein product [Didymodactylos carnosus]CAF3795020.1 unnamed protein product [Didymodactylos carnosus]CAF4209958.1 unnamed protein product [Didymodactylos carnosus]
MGHYLKTANREIADPHVFCVDDNTVDETITWCDQYGYQQKLRDVFKINKLEYKLIHIGIDYCKTLKDYNSKNKNIAEAQRYYYDALALVEVLGRTIEQFRNDIPDFDTPVQPA